MSTAGETGAFHLGMFILTIAITFSYQISYCPIGSDYSRYLPHETPLKKVWLSSFMGCLSACVWLEILGALTATLALQTNSNPMDFIARLMGVFTIPALITVVLSIFPVNAMSIYSGGLATLAMGLPMKRWLTAIVVGGLGALAISFGGGSLADTYKNFLLLLSYWIAPWLGILLTDFFYCSALPLQKNHSNGWPGIVAFICGIVISVPFMSSMLFVGPIAKYYLGGGDVSYFLSMVMGAVIYLGILKIQGVKPLIV
jgi:NCS1 family nucleobase:cation symporter-1